MADSTMDSRAPDRQFVSRGGLTLIETVIALALIALLVSLLWPALSSARVTSHRDRCQANQRVIGEAWHSYLQEHAEHFPYVPVQTGWLWGGARISAQSRTIFPDFQRPLTPYLHIPNTENPDHIVCFCPADHGIRLPGDAAVGHRTAFQSYGTSYRANSELLSRREDEGELHDPKQIDAASQVEAAAGRAGGGGRTPRADEPTVRSLSRNRITASPSRLLLSGDAIWYELAHSTGRDADWHHNAAGGNILFLDGSVRFIMLGPRSDRNQAVVLDPMAPDESAPE